jgi:hypothetical protein
MNFVARITADLLLITVRLLGWLIVKAESGRQKCRDFVMRGVEQEPMSDWHPEQYRR